MKRILSIIMIILTTAITSCAGNNANKNNKKDSMETSIKDKKTLVVSFHIRGKTTLSAISLRVTLISLLK